MPTLRRDNEVFTVAERLPVLALRDVVIFPHVTMPLLVGRPASLAAVDSAMAEDRYILLVTQRSGDTDEPAAADLYRGGVVARIAQLARQSQKPRRLQQHAGRAVQEAANFFDNEGRKEGMRQFLDDKTYKPGVGTYDISKKR